ncbi:hypothetical protein [Streptomyces sp. NPDC093149]|uniref:hypothetical protein n=1 Tax=Streptomyces sp. NPDC093149 TaxID=3366031 RepID=UPI00380BC1C2
MAGTTSTVKYEAYLVEDTEGEWAASATFGSGADPGDMWAFVDAAKARIQRRYPTLTFTGHVVRYDEVTTEIPHP